MTIKLVLMPVIAAFIGWGTNVLAIRMLFWPRKPIRIPLIGYEFCGLLPKRQSDIARSIGEIINDELLPIQSLVDAVNTKEMRQHLAHLICTNIESKLKRFVPAFLLRSIQGLFDNVLKDLVAREIGDLIANLGSDLATELQSTGLLARLVEEKIRSYDITGLESLILQVARTELRYIELLGAILGGMIGLIQTAIVYLV
ncbi:MAG: DUF445 family protein [Firmicutes bacterium]|jgi:uncharacterized membrane protein YheB (UPF0754 family)|nr:DUF445 family protein [Bacillota bacterium]